MWEKKIKKVWDAPWHCAVKSENREIRRRSNWGAFLRAQMAAGSRGDGRGWWEGMGPGGGRGWWHLEKRCRGRGARRRHEQPPRFPAGRWRGLWPTCWVPMVTVTSRWGGVGAGPTPPVVIQEAIIVLATFANDSVIIGASGGGGGERRYGLSRGAKTETASVHEAWRRAVVTVFKEWLCNQIYTQKMMTCERLVGS